MLFGYAMAYFAPQFPEQTEAVNAFDGYFS